MKDIVIGKRFTKEMIFNEIKNYFFIFLGLFIFSFAWSAFLIPHQLTGGGISGMSAILYFATGFPIGITVLIGNIILVLISIKILGKEFALRTIICSVMLSIAFSIMKPLFPKPLVDDMFLCSLIGAMLSGVGVGMALNNGGNTGGTDIIALMIGKYRSISYGRLTLYINVFIVASSFLIVGSVEKLVYSFVVMIAYTFASDLVLDGFRQTYQIMVFSDKNQEISQQINSQLNRGATMIKGYGSYSKKEKDILLVIAHKGDKRNIIRIIKNVDKSAFISIAKANSVYGKNFDEIKL
ncbi:MAG: YitT family protein [Bacteroidales bacterium]|nr:YitT family protein [Bacteroidales bacterium]